MQPSVTVKETTSKRVKLSDETVRFNINGVMYDRKISGDKGLAKLNINLEAGDYVITAINLVTGDKSSNTITVLSRITENADLIKYYRNSSLSELVKV